MGRIRCCAEGGNEVSPRSVRGLARRGLGLLAAGLLTAGSISAVAEEPGRDRFDTVVIDPGHGGDDHGAAGGDGLREKDLVLDVSQRLASKLEALGMHVLLTRTEDVFVPLEERTSIANDARAKLFVSIHANASGLRGVRGIETFFASAEATDESARALAEQENRAFAGQGLPAAAADPLVAILGDLLANEHLHASQEFARMAQQRLVPDANGHSRGVKQAPFVVLMGVQMPAALVEIGFLTNAEDETALRSEAERERLADALASAVQSFRERYDARRGLAPAVDRTGTRGENEDR